MTGRQAARTPPDGRANLKFREASGFFREKALGLFRGVNAAQSAAPGRSGPDRSRTFAAMKTSVLRSLVVVGSTLAFATLAPGQNPPPVSTDKLQIAPPEAMDASMRKLAGQPVTGANGEDLGTIRDFVVEKSTGRVVYAVVSTGGLFGVGNTLRLVPIYALHAAPNGARGFQVRVSRVDWDRTPSLIDEAFSAGLVVVTTEQAKAHQDLFGNGPSRRAAATPAPRAGEIPPGNRDAALAASPWIRASDLRGKPVMAGAYQVGKVDDVVLNLRDQTAAALVDVDDHLVATSFPVVVPVDEFDFERAGRDRLVTRLTRENLASLDPGRAGLEPVLTPTGRPSSDDGIHSAAATLASAARSARQALDQIPELARADIRVTAENDMLLLRGRVATEQLKSRAAAAVEDAASGIKLRNELAVGPR